MLNFPCHCGYKFALNDDQAGSSVQCPQCGRLNDVPTLSEIQQIGADGTYLLDLAPERTEHPDTLREMRLAFSKDKTDEDGNEIDLRSTAEDIRKAGVSDAEFAPPNELKPGILKYDPETGELIRPLEIRQDPRPVVAIPMAQRAQTLSYATADVRHHHVNAIKLFWELLKPMNLIVMFFVLIAHFLVLLMLTTCIMSVGSFVLLFGILGHYAIVVEETGPNDQDELPRLFRHADWSEDIWGPFTHAFCAVAYCFGPCLLALMFLPYRFGKFAALSYLAYGFVMFPAAFLTTTTSGTISNLRPDRLFGVMKVLGAKYLWLLIVLAPMAAAYPIGMIAILLNVFGSHVRAWFAYPIFMVAVYLGHYFCWYLGLLWRHYHDQFPWVMQFHVRASKAEQGALMSANTAVRRAALDARRAGNPRLRL